VTGITIALSKGRIFDETLPLLEAAGVAPLEDPETSRKLILPTVRPDVRLVIVRANNLRVVEEIMPVSSRLIVNQAALKMKRTALQPLIERFEAAVATHA
jgi:ATP phosphoribosyltransferase